MVAEIGEPTAIGQTIEMIEQEEVETGPESATASRIGISDCADGTRCRRSRSLPFDKKSFRPRTYSGR
jgi:hypothetical protein